ncbi:MAG: M56 family metallopeptidase [Chitinophagaceae bacterium]
MPYIAQYFIKLSISLGVVYLFYALVLRRLTFYNWNRWYLLGYSILALLIPFINISPVLETHEWTNAYVIQMVPVMGAYTAEKAQGPSAAAIAWTILFSVMGIGIAVMLLRLLLQYISFRQVRKTAELLSDDSVKVYQVDKDIVPFSFGNSIFINHQRYNEVELKEIIRHEFIHVKQRHTVDVLWSELLCVLNWYNPFAWLIRRSIRQNLEFIADHQVLQAGLDRKQYQYMLLKVVGGTAFTIGNQFNFSTLKKRIAMMNKIRSARVNAIRFLFALPLLMVLLLAFRNVIADSDSNGQGQEIIIAGLVLDAASMQPLGNVKVISGTLQTTSDEHGYYKLRLKNIAFPLKLNVAFRKDGYETMVSTGSISGKPKGNVLGAIDYIGLAKKNSANPNSFVWSSVKKSIKDNDITYADIMTDFSVSQKNMVKGKKVWTLAANSQKSYWVQEGSTYVFSEKMSSASVDEVTDIVFVDGKRMTGEEVNATIPRNSVRGVGAIEKADALKKYGINQAVVELYVNAYTLPAAVKDTTPAPKATAATSTTITLSYTTRDTMIDASLNGPQTPYYQNVEKGVLGFRTTNIEHQPLLILDGKEVPYNDIHNVDPQNINIINILKDASAVEQYGDKGKNGVIVIELKDNGTPATPNRKVLDLKLKPASPLQQPLQQPAQQQPVTIRGRNSNEASPLYFVDGKRYDSVGFAKLSVDPVNIESVEVLKPDAGTEIYGAAGRNGVISLKLKKEGEEKQ